MRIFQRSHFFVCVVSLLFCTLAIPCYASESGLKNMVLKDLKQAAVPSKKDGRRDTASLMIPETQSSDTVFLKGSDKTVKLGFTLRCDQLSLQDEESSVNVTVLKDGNSILSHTIRSGDPLRYSNYVFRLVSYQAYSDFILQVRNKKTGSSMTKITPFQEKISWKEEGVAIGIVNAEAAGDIITKVKIWFSDGKGPADIFWLPFSQEHFAEIEKGEYIIKGKQLYAVGLDIEIND